MRDQAALYGLISRIRDLGLTLLSVNRVDKKLGESMKNKQILTYWPILSALLILFLVLAACQNEARLAAAVATLEAVVQPADAEEPPLEATTIPPTSEPTAVPPTAYGYGDHRTCCRLRTGFRDC